MTINQPPQGQPVDYSGHVPGYGIDPQPVAQPVQPQVTVKVAKPVKQSRDRAQYTRQQKGHSLILHLLFGGFVLWIPTIYFAASPNHYFHA